VAEAKHTFKFTPSVAALVVANLLPLYGLFVLKWDVFPLILLYWLENAIVGGFTVLKMLFSAGPMPFRVAAKVLMVPFFIVHYGGFLVGHGAFVIVLFGGREPRGGDIVPAFGEVVELIFDHGLIVPVVGLICSHGFSFAWNYLYKGEYKRTVVMQAQGTPYLRVIVLHLAILFGGVLAMTLGSPLYALLLLVALKIGFDAYAHRRERTRAERRLQSRMRKLAEKLQEPLDAGGPDSFAEAHPDYRRDEGAERRFRRFWLLGCLPGGIAFVGALLLFSGGLRAAGVCFVAFAFAWVVGSVLLHGHRWRTLCCRSCGRRLERAQTRAKLHELNRVQRRILQATQVLAAAKERLKPWPMQEWYVCHACKSYLFRRQIQRE